LAKEGWPRHQANGPVPLKGADGVVCSREWQFIYGLVRLRRQQISTDRRQYGPKRFEDQTILEPDNLNAEL
jgi:hypothetical protein